MKIVREHINEKFTEDSDPIQDMGIGVRHKIKQWIKKMNDAAPDQIGIKNYRINKDGSITVNGNCSLPNGCGNIPEFIKFKIIKGDFIISGCDMTSLQGCPEIVHGKFLCYNNRVRFTKKDVRKICKVGKEIVVK